MQQNHLSDDQILSRLCVHYHDDFRSLCQNYLQPNELLIWIGNFSYNGYGYGVVPRDIGYVLVTSERIFRVSFRTNDGFFNNREVIKGPNNVAVIEVPRSPLTKAEKNSRYVLEVFLKNIKSIRRQDYKFSDSMIVVEIVIKDLNVIRFNNKDEGQELYNFLYDFVQKNNQVESVIPPNFPELLQKLEDLHKYQIIDDDTYNAAKRKLLS